MVDIHDLVGAYAVDALDQLDRDAYEAHLTDCESCRQELADLHEGAAAIAQHVATNPPAALKQRVMASIAAPSATPLTSIGPSPRRFRSGWALAGIAAMLVVLVGLWAMTNARLSEAETVAAVYTAPDAATIDLTSPAGAARFVYSPSLATGVFTTYDLAEPEENRVYELWLVGESGPAPAGTFRPNPGEVSVVVVRGVEAGLVVALTEEPPGGSAGPSGDILMSAEL